MRRHNAITISPNREVVVLFSRSPMSENFQLTPNGVHPVEIITARVLTSPGLAVLAQGEAIRQPEDERNSRLGSKLALERALQEAGDLGILDYSERAAIWHAFFGAKKLA